ncbi:MAG TPA: hypothetical protein VIS07_13875 [Candidatus Binatia bacterium]
MPYVRLVVVLLLTASFGLAGCPVSSVAGKGNGATRETRDLDPGPPSVFNPTLLDRG